MKYNITAIMILALMLVGCSTDDFSSSDGDAARDNVVSVAVNGNGWSEGRDGGGTRADDPIPFENVKPASVGVWGLYATGIPGRPQGTAIPNDYVKTDQNNNTHAYIGSYAYLNNYPLTPNPDSPSHEVDATRGYHYTAGSASTSECSGGFPWDDTRYWFYCYAPHVKDIEAAHDPNVLFTLLKGDKTTVFNPTADAPGNPQTIKYLKIESLPSIMHSDIAIARQYHLWDRLPNQSHSNVYGPCPDFVDDEHCLDHLYSSLQVCFALSKEYAEIRYLHIKKVSIRIDDKTTTYTAFKDVTGPSAIELVPQVAQTDATPFDIIRDDFYIGKDDNAPEAYRAFGHAFLCPNGLVGNHKIYITVVYDVYDRNRQITRSDAIATSSVAIPANGVLNIKCDSGVGCGRKHTPDDCNRFLPGHYYNISIKVNPDFLYVLSDNDAAADIIIKAGQ